MPRVVPQHRLIEPVLVSVLPFLISYRPIPGTRRNQINKNPPRLSLTHSFTPGMPRPVQPPTPGSSSDIKGQDGTQQLASLQLAFELPPPAVNDASRISPIELKHPSPPSFSNNDPNNQVYPVQAAESVKSRQRSAAAKMSSKEPTFTLPPPPTRSRKIIQMKPRSLDDGKVDMEIKETKKTGAKKTPGSGGSENQNRGSWCRCHWQG